MIANARRPLDTLLVSHPCRLLKWTASSLPGSRERAPWPATPSASLRRAKNNSDDCACSTAGDPESQTTPKPRPNKGLGQSHLVHNPADYSFEALRGCGAQQVCYLRFVGSGLQYRLRSVGGTERRGQSGSASWGHGATGRRHSVAPNGRGTQGGTG